MSCLRPNVDFGQPKHHGHSFQCPTDSREVHRTWKYTVFIDFTKAATWSDYKHRNTLKFLFAVTPQGSAAYV